MQSLYHNLTLLNPLDLLDSASFYHDLLRKHGVPEEMWLDIHAVYGQSRQRDDELVKIWAATPDILNQVSANALEEMPTNVNVMHTIAERAASSALRTVLGLAARNVAQELLRKRNTILRPGEYDRIDGVGLQMIARGLVELGEYEAVTRYMMLLMNQMKMSTPVYLEEAMFTLALKPDAQAQELFKMTSSFLSQLVGEEFPPLIALARVVQHYVLHGVDQKLCTLLRELSATNESIDLLLRQYVEVDEDDSIVMTDLADLINGRIIEIDEMLDGFDMVITDIAKNDYRLVITPNAPPSETVISPETPSHPDDPFKTLYRLYGRQKFTSIEEAQAFANSMIGKRVEDLPLHELTEDEIAQDLCEETRAFEPSKRKMLLEEIAKDHPKSMWPWIELFSLTKNSAERLALCEEGLKSGVRFATVEYISENRGNYYLIPETRPYMQLLARKGQALVQLNRIQDAVDVYVHAMELNSADNQGMRFVLLPLLLFLGTSLSMEQAANLIKRFKNDSSGLFLWSKLLFQLIINAPQRTVVSTLNNAWKSNKLIGAMLAQWPLKKVDAMGEKMGFEDVDDAVSYMQFGAPAWDTQKKALKALKELLRLKM